MWPYVTKQLNSGYNTRWHIDKMKGKWLDISQQHTLLLNYTEIAVFLG